MTDSMAVSPELLNELVATHGEALVRYARWCFGFDESTARDVVQDAMLIVLDKLPTLDALTPAYLDGAVINAGRDAFKRGLRRPQRADQRADDDDGDTRERVAPARGIGSRIDARDRLARIAGIPGGVHLIEAAAGDSSRDIAARHGLSENAVDKKKSRARQHPEFLAVEAQFRGGMANATYAGGIDVCVVTPDGREVPVEAAPATRLRLHLDGFLRGRLRLDAATADFALLAVTDRSGERTWMSAPFDAAVEDGELALEAFVHEPSRSDMSGDGIEWPASCVRLWLFAA